jgi:hypothetical protein
MYKEYINKLFTENTDTHNTTTEIKSETCSLRLHNYTVYIVVFIHWWGCWMMDVGDGVYWCRLYNNHHANNS